MERIMYGLNRIFHGNKRQMLTAAAAAFIVYVLLLSGIFSYFHSEDAVTNRLTAPQGSVAIQEPKWDGVGQYMAKAAEPGMEIPKDPSGWNDGSVDVYIRLKMTVELGTFESKNTTYDGTYQYTDDERRNAILNVIKLENGGSFLNSGRTATNNTSFYMETATENGDPVYYFYYMDSAGDMATVRPGRLTEVLFDYLDIPVYKADYFGVFDQKYEIILTAEGIPAANYPDGLKANEAAAEFQ